MKQDDQHVFQTVQNLQQLRCKLLRQHRLNKTVMVKCLWVIFIEHFQITARKLHCKYFVHMRYQWNSYCARTRTNTGKGATNLHFGEDIKIYYTVSKWPDTLNNYRLCLYDNVQQLDHEKLTIMDTIYVVISRV